MGANGCSPLGGRTTARLDQFVRPIAARLAGPAIGGALVAGVGAGAAFTVDAVSFAGSLLALLALPAPGRPQAEHRGSSLGALKEGLGFVRRRVWLWGTLLSAAVAYLLFLGPTEVLLPYLVKNSLHGSARDLVSSSRPAGSEPSSPPS